MIKYQKIYHVHFFTFKVLLHEKSIQYVFKLFKTMFYLKLNFILKMTKKPYTFKNVEEIKKPKINTQKTFGSPV